MARVVALVPDLLFGSKVQAMLAAGGHEVQMTGVDGLREHHAGADVRAPADDALRADPGLLADLGEVPHGRAVADDRAVVDVSGGQDAWRHGPRPPPRRARARPRCAAA